MDTESVADPVIAKELKRSIKRLVAAEAAYTKQIGACIDAHPEFRRISERLQDESGVGLQTAATLLAYFPELGRINRQQAAALAGLAPYDHASGTHDGKRAIFGGTRRIRRALYLAAISAARWSSWVKSFYANLRARGKCAKVALIACVRKPLVRLNSLAGRALSDVHGGAQRPLRGRRAAPPSPPSGRVLGSVLVMPLVLRGVAPRSRRAHPGQSHAERARLSPSQASSMCAF